MGDLIGTLAAIIIPLLLIARQVFLAQQQAKKGPQAGPPRGARPGGRPPGNPVLDDEIDQFLRRAAEHRAGGAPREVELFEPKVQQPAVREAKRRPERPKPAPQPVAVELVHDDAFAVSEGRETVVQHHLDSVLSSRRLEPVGTQRAEHQFEERMHDAFDHSVGTIGLPLGESGEPASARTDGSLANSIRERLSNPQSLREAVIMQEIFRRPI